MTYRKVCWACRTPFTTTVKDDKYCFQCNGKNVGIPTVALCAVVERWAERRTDVPVGVPRVRRIR